MRIPVGVKNGDRVPRLVLAKPAKSNIHKESIMPSKLTPEQIKTKRKNLIRQTWAAIKEKKKNKALRLAESGWKKPKDSDEVPLLDVIEPDADTDGLPITIGSSGEPSPANLIEDSTSLEKPPVLFGEEEDPPERTVKPSNLTCVCRMIIGVREKCFLFKRFPLHSISPADLENVKPMRICNGQWAQKQIDEDANLVMLHRSWNCVRRYKEQIVMKLEEPVRCPAEPHPEDPTSFLNEALRCGAVSLVHH